MWHLNDEVYNQQLKLEVENFKINNNDSVKEYNDILSDSKFSLCPVGAGPNTIRLWESLAIGSIPVVISDQYEFPYLTYENGETFNWTDAVIIHPESDLVSLEKRLLNFNQETLDRMFQACQIAYELILNKTCFSKIQPKIYNDYLLKISEPRSIKIFIPYYGSEDKYFWRTSLHGLHDLVMEWHNRGWCDIEHHEGPYYWINGIGSILLFDRDQVNDLIDKKKPVPRWEGEVSYKYALFVNEYGLENDRNFKFNYWSYKPIELERIVKENLLISYKERNIDSIFLGTIENETQEFFRNKFKEYSLYIDEYFVANKLDKNEKSKYAFNEYLSKVAHSKFGICFRGNGPKCYREIEYAAMGTPLIITEGVEVDYPDPLIENIHYFKAKSPAEILDIVSNTTQDTWIEMSLNCRRWYERNFTTKSQFDKLQDLILRLDTTLEKPKTVYINGKNELDYKLTFESCKIFNPLIDIVKDVNLNASGLVLNAGDIVINEFPYLNSGNSYKFISSKNNLQKIKEKILNSNLLVYKKLASLLNWRLRDYKVELFKFDKKIDVDNYISENKILINDPEIDFNIEVDYDYCRNLSGKYYPVVFSGRGPLIFPLIHIVKATLVYENSGIEISCDITSKFSEYFSTVQKLDNNDYLWRKFKLWEFEGFKDGKIIVLYESQNEEILTIIYTNLTFNANS
jgi:hypothetical protein